MADTCHNGTRTVDAYRAHVEAFNEAKRGIKLGAVERCLFYALLEQANILKWPESFTVDSGTLVYLSGCSRSSCLRARGELRTAGLISYEESTGNLSGTYRLTVVK